MLRETGYEVFIQTIRKNMEQADALRIDHALGLFRLFWIPRGASPLEGAYVRYPHEDLLRIIALESARSGTVVIAEDLGTVGEEVRETLGGFGLLTYKLLYFERDWQSGEFLPPGAYPREAIASINTHDLPTAWGYWAGRDIEERHAMGAYHGDGEHRAEVEKRQRDKALLLEALRREGMPENLPSSAEAAIDDALALAMHRYLGRTPCAMVAVSLDDIMHSLGQQNMPGAGGKYPSWRLKGPETMESLPASAFARALGGIFRQEGRTAGGG